MDKLKAKVVYVPELNEYIVKVFDLGKWIPVGSGSRHICVWSFEEDALAYIGGNNTLELVEEDEFKIGDEVYYISFENKYNDLYRQEMEWQVYGRFDNPSKEEILTKITEESKMFLIKKYKLSNGYIINEDNIFKDLDSAKQECEKRNNN